VVALISVVGDSAPPVERWCSWLLLKGG
jgi:hypothetical protein